MRGLAIPIAAAALAAAVAPTARADLRPFEGTLAIRLGTLPPLEATGAGLAIVNGSAGGGHVSSLVLPGGAFGPSTATLTDSAWTNPRSIRMILSSNQSGLFAGLSGGSGGGPMGLSGRVLLCLFVPGCSPGLSLVLPLSTNAGATGVGVGGTIVAPGAVKWTVGGLGPWTQGTATIMNVNTAAPTQTFTRMGFAHGPGSLASTTNQGSGVLQLVTPLDIRTSLPNSIPQIPSFAVLTLRFVPEPGTVLLLGAGAAALAVLGRKRVRP